MKNPQKYTMLKNNIKPQPKTKDSLKDIRMIYEWQQKNRQQDRHMDRPPRKLSDSKETEK